MHLANAVLSSGILVAKWYIVYLISNVNDPFLLPEFVLCLFKNCLKNFYALFSVVDSFFPAFILGLFKCMTVDPARIWKIKPKGGVTCEPAELVAWCSANKSTNVELNSK